LNKQRDPTTLYQTDATSSTEARFHITLLVLKPTTTKFQQLQMAMKMHL